MNVVNILWWSGVVALLFVDINLNISHSNYDCQRDDDNIYSPAIHSILDTNYVTFDCITNEEQIIK